MASRDIYENAFDEDVQADSSANPCPECGGHVITNSVETVCEDCGLVLESQPIDHGPEWRSFVDNETDFGANRCAAHADSSQWRALNRNLIQDRRQREYALGLKAVPAR